MSGFIWLASYPKSGSTWLRLALESLAQCGAPVRLNDERGRAGLGSLRDMFEDVLCVDTSHLSADEIDELRPRSYEIIGRETEPPKILKVHDAWTLTKAGVPLFPRAATAGAIYLVRDPRDVAVSCAYHEGIAFDVQIERMAMADYRASVSIKSLRRQVPQHFLSWSAHVQSWLDAPNCGCSRCVTKTWSTTLPHSFGASPLSSACLTLRMRSRAPSRRRDSRCCSRPKWRRASANGHGTPSCSSARVSPAAGSRN